MQRLNSRNQWQLRYAHSIDLLSASLNFLNETFSHSPCESIQFDKKNVPAYFEEHNALIELVVRTLNKITDNEDGGALSVDSDSSLQKLRYAIHRENENYHLASIGYDTQPSLLSKHQDKNPKLNYKEAYFEILELTISVIADGYDCVEHVEIIKEPQHKTWSTV